MKPQIFPTLLALLAGAILPFAFAPFHFFWIAIIAPALLLMLWQNISPKIAFLRGLCFGLGFFGVGVSWIFVSIYVYGGVNTFFSGAITFLFVFVMSLYIAIQGYFYSSFFPRENKYGIYLGFTTIWILFEWLRSILFTGFPWLLLGYSQVSSPLKGYIPIVGEYGTAFILLLLSAALYQIYISTKNYFQKNISCKNVVLQNSYNILLIILMVLIGALFAKVPWTKPIGNPISVAMIQGNVPQNIKWSSEALSSILNKYDDLTAQNWNHNLIIWPESAIPLPLPQAQNYIDDLNNAVKQKNVALLTGIPIQTSNQFSYYNALIVLGDGKGVYYKRHLVPFGEYVPLQKFFGEFFAWLQIPMSNLTDGPMQQSDLQAKNIIIGPFICYEIAYPEIVRLELPKAQLLLTITDDAWFGNSFAPAQQTQIAQFRALQTGRDLLSSSNNGITAIITAHGRIIKSLPQFQVGVLTGTVQPRVGATPWVIIGNWPIILLMFIIFVVSFLLRSGISILKRKD